MDRVKRIWYLSPMRAAKVQASLRIRAVSPELPLLAHTSSESRETFRQKTRPLAPLNGWACAVKICHDGMLEGTNSLDGARIMEDRLTHSYWISKLLLLHPPFLPPGDKRSSLQMIDAPNSGGSMAVRFGTPPPQPPTPANCSSSGRIRKRAKAHSQIRDRKLQI